MKKIEFLIGNALAACADVGSGLMIATGLSLVFSHYHKHLLIYVAAVFFALLPDFDVAIKAIQTKIRGGQLDSRHRTILHQPFYFILTFVLWLILCLALGWPLIWPLMFVLGAIAHFIHDSVGDENYPGIQWLAPFDKKKFAFWCRRAWQGEQHFIVVSSPDADGMEYENWLQTFYLRLSREVVVEGGWFVLWAFLALIRILS